MESHSRKSDCLQGRSRAFRIGERFHFLQEENIYVQLVILHFLNKINSTYIPRNKRERKAGGAKRSCHTQKRSLSESQTELCQRGLGFRPMTSGVWETRDECLQATRRDQHHSGQEGRARSGAERRQVVLAPGPCQTPQQRKPSEHPITKAPQSMGQWGADTG